MIGSAEYTAPEQARCKAIFASDIYSLGVTCIYLLTGVSPFNLYDTGNGRWVWRDFLPKAVGTELGELLDKMIQMSTNKRYQTVRDVQADLASINLKDGINNKASQNLESFSSAPVPEKQKPLFERSNSYEVQRLQPELQKEESQPVPLQISAEQPGELAVSLPEKLVLWLQSLRLPAQQARALLACFSISFTVFLLYAPRTIQSRQSSPSSEWVNNEIKTTVLTDTSIQPDSLPELLNSEVIKPSLTGVSDLDSSAHEFESATAILLQEKQNIRICDAFCLIF